MIYQTNNISQNGNNPTLPTIFNEHFVTCFVFFIRHLYVPLSFFLGFRIISLWFPIESFSNRYLSGWSVGISSSPLYHLTCDLGSLTVHSSVVNGTPTKSRFCFWRFVENLWSGSRSVWMNFRRNNIIGKIFNVKIEYMQVDAFKNAHNMQVFRAIRIICNIHMNNISKQTLCLYVCSIRST